MVEDLTMSAKLHSSIFQRLHLLLCVFKACLECNQSILNSLVGMTGALQETYSLHSAPPGPPGVTLAALNVYNHLIVLLLSLLILYSVSK